MYPLILKGASNHSKWRTTTLKRQWSRWEFASSFWSSGHYELADVQQVIHPVHRQCPSQEYSFGKSSQSVCEYEFNWFRRCDLKILVSNSKNGLKNMDRCTVSSSGPRRWSFCWATLPSKICWIKEWNLYWSSGHVHWADSVQWRSQAAGDGEPPHVIKLRSLAQLVGNSGS